MMIYVILGASALAVGGYALVCLYRSHLPSGRMAVVVGFPVLCALMFAAWSEVAGRPKPVEAEWRSLNGATVLFVDYREGVAIWLVVRMAGVSDPVYYRLPWSKQFMEKTIEAAMTAGDGSGTVTLGIDAEGDPMPYALPQEPEPTKDTGAGISAARPGEPGV